MSTNRRQFFGQIVTAAVAAGAVPAATPTVMTGPSSLPAAVEHGWTWLRITGFKPAMDSTALVCQIIARRTDGQYCYVHWAVPQDDFTPGEINTTMQFAFDTLETFRTCACSVEKRCPGHVQFGPESGWPGATVGEDR